MADSKDRNGNARRLQRDFMALSQRADLVADERRRSAVQGLVSSKGFAETVSNLSRGDTYRVVLSKPVRGSLNARSDGLLDAFIKGKDGKMAAVARLENVGSALLSSATMLAGHLMLMQISAQLDRLQGSIDEVLAKMDNARIGQINAAMSYLSEQAFYKPEHREDMLRNAVQKLDEAFHAALQDVTHLVEKIPSPSEWNITRALWDNSGRTAEQLDKAATSLRIALLCLEAIGKTQIQLNGEDGATGIMVNRLEQLLDLPLRQAELQARRIPIARAEDRRDTFWIDARHTLETMRDKLLDFLDDERPIVTRIDVTGAEILALPEAPNHAPSSKVADPATAARPEPRREEPRFRQQ